MNTDIIIVLLILSITVVMFVLDIVRIDLVAIMSMLALGWSGILTPEEMFAGFSSNAVISIIAVMIMGRGIARTGLMDKFSIAMIKLAG
ncbi:MAG: SLC13 family permease, partial [Bacteroidota bacterium]